ncbi:phosphodiester glycosidase family protein [Anaerosolibacter sp.]|uniref:phosphodiester glycosidase family protein n=1 Tax=Anaerosolibacter sp. TaxID=1872527 RepID=UPI0039EE75F9
MQGWKKWIITSTLAISLTSSGFLMPVNADWTQSLYEEKKEEYISSGVKHEQLLRFTDKGWVNVNVMRINLQDNFTSLDMLFNQNGLGTKARLSELANQNPQVIGAINGDFFNTKGAATLGPIVKDGELVSTPYYIPTQMAVFNQSKDGTPFINYWASEIVGIMNKRSITFLKIGSINKESDYGDTAILFTPAFGGKTPALSPNLSGAVEMVIEDNVVKEINYAKEGTTIPQNGSVVFATGTFAALIESSFAVGDEIEISASTNPDYQSLALAMGGGAVVLKDGVVPTIFSHNITGNHPRTAIGISRDNKEVILVTVDGRTASYTGVTQKELGEIMAYLGAQQAINLDGGGSTEMLLRPLGDENKKIVNTLSDGSERRLMNGIGVVNTAPQTAIAGVKLQTQDSNVFVNTSRQLEIKVYDKNYNPLPVDYSRVKWHITGAAGTFNGNIFRPTAPGKAAIVAEYDGKYATLEMNVLDQPVNLKLSPNKLFVDKNGERAITMTAVDGDGYSATLSSQDINFEVPQHLGHIDQRGFFKAASQNGSGIIKGTFKGLEAYIQVAVGSQEVVIDDFEAVNGSFLSYPAEVTGTYEIAPFPKSGSSAGTLSYDFTTTDATRAAYLEFNNGGIRFEKPPAKIGLWVYGNEGGGHGLKAKLVGADGTAHTINLATAIDWSGWKYVEAPVPSTLKVPVVLERIYVVETNPLAKGTGRIYMDGLTVSYPSNLDGTVPQVPIQDARNVSESPKGANSYKFFAHGAVSGIDTLLDQMAVTKLAQLSNDNAELNVFTSTLDSSLKDSLTKTVVLGDGNYTAVKHKNSLFVQLDNRKSSLRESNVQQWTWFINTIKAAESKQIFVVLPKPLSFSDPLEEKLFKDTLTKAKQEKNIDVWVLSGGGSDFTVTPQNGVRYVTLKDYPLQNDMDIFTQLKYMVFTVNDDKVTYEVLPMYTK